MMFIFHKCTYVIKTPPTNYTSLVTFFTCFYYMLFLSLSPSTDTIPLDDLDKLNTELTNLKEAAQK